MTRRLDAFARWFAVATFVGWIVLLAFTLGMASSADAAALEANRNQPAPELEERRPVPQTSVEQVSRTVMCPSCDTTLDQSSSPAAERMRAWVIAAVEAGWTEQEIRDGLVREYGGDESVLATPRAQGVGLAVWLVPAFIALAAIAGGVLMLRGWRRGTVQMRSTSSEAKAASASQASASSASGPGSSPSAR